MLYLLTGALLLTKVLGQDGCENKSYKSKIGLDFQITCETNAAGNDIRNSTKSSLETCIDDCAVSLPGQEFGACRAVSYNVDTRRCFFKDGNVTSNDFTSSNATITALADAAPFEFDPNSSPCPSGNGTVHTDDNGMEYTVLCDLYWSGNNYDPAKSAESAYQAFHADTLTDCMNYCSENSPFCFGVRWMPSSEEYYRNCWPKKANTTHSSSKLEAREFAVAAVGILNVNSTCTGSSKIYTASNQATLTQSCDTTGDGPDIEKLHAANYEECMDRCAEYESNEGGNTQCGGVLYQPNAKQGFENCYLKYALSNVTGQADWHMAILETRGESTQEGGSESKAWIAGAVAGPVVGIAAVVGIFFWYRRRKAAKKTAPGPDHSKSASEAVPFNTTGGSSGYYAHDVDSRHKYDHAAMTPPPPFSTHPHTPPVSEMPSHGREAGELPANTTVRHELQ